MHYGMFTSEGNVAIAGIVEYAKMHNLSWATVYQNLVDLSNFDEKYAEVRTFTFKNEAKCDS